MGGICASGYKEDKEAAEANRKINQILSKERRLLDDEFKLLLLGTGESGKSTIVKQMKIIHMAGFSKEEKSGFIRMIVHSEEEEIEILRSMERGPMNILLPNMANIVTKLWLDETIQLVFNDQKYFLPDSLSYFMENAKRIGEEGYVPTDLDILKVRIKTTGIVETHFLAGNNRYRIVDVGGQRNERKKWIHCFSDVTAIVFCVASNEYDMMLEEDKNVNRMQESLKLFGEIINNEFFWNTKIILLLNKEDLLKEKCLQVDLSHCFPNYDGGLNFDNASKYIQRKFLDKNKNSNRKIYSKFACATDTSNIRYIFTLLEQFLLEDLLRTVF